MTGLRPRLRPGDYAFVELAADADLAGLGAVATVREDEWLTAVVPAAVAAARGLPVLFRAAWITLEADTALDDLGVTAAFARALADAGIACNVFAGARHDHVFVPVDRAAAAVAALRRVALR